MGFVILLKLFLVVPEYFRWLTTKVYHVHLTIWKQYFEGHPLVLILLDMHSHALVSCYCLDLTPRHPPTDSNTDPAFTEFINFTVSRWGYSYA